MIAGGRSTGFLLSGLLHLAVTTAFVTQVDHSSEQNNEDGPLSLTLAMFETAASPAPVPEPMPTTPAKVEPEKPITKAAPPRPEPKHRPKPLAPIAPVTEPVVHSRTVTTNNGESMPGPEPARTAGMAPAIKQETLQAPASSLQQASLKRRYLKRLLARIHRKKHYPYQARRRHEEGEVLVSFVIGQAGEISSIRVSRSSGHPSLDKAAIKTVTRVSPMIPLPAELGISRWELAVPIAFNLRK
ncbi:energy transducer TonB [Sulfuriflexus sp.]|uniref:energy transducer TonB n=1 Tax=Sulfuriflexus sp. TaxID=2015443 RepID=UPI0028CC80BF|nr:energy transducer TonB [Sulfuriflexus sp.]MDT8404844.1 energy transducer TonB [Sulfuriflexus sp.]